VLPGQTIRVAGNTDQESSSGNAGVRTQPSFSASRKRISRRVALLYFVASAIAAIPLSAFWGYYIYWVGDTFLWWVDTKEIILPEVALFFAITGSSIWVALLALCNHLLARKWNIDPWGAALYGSLVGIVPGFIVGLLPPVLALYLFAMSR